MCSFTRAYWAAGTTILTQFFASGFWPLDDIPQQCCEFLSWFPSLVCITFQPGISWTLLLCRGKTACKVERCLPIKERLYFPLPLVFSHVAFIKAPRSMAAHLEIDTAKPKCLDSPFLSLRNTQSTLECHWPMEASWEFLLQQFIHSLHQAATQELSSNNRKVCMQEPVRVEMEMEWEPCLPETSRKSTEDTI